MNASSPVFANPVEILIAEDSPTQAKRLRNILEKAGHHVRHAADGLLALDALQQFPPAAVVISDINMPEIDGYELCRRIKADPATACLPVVLVTSMDDPRHVLLSLECGADSFLLKPFSEAILQSRVQTLLAQRASGPAEPAGPGLEIIFHGETHVIKADRRHILNLLLSTYDATQQQNTELKSVQEELRRTNQSLVETNRRLEQEITEREKSNAALRESEERFRDTFEQAAVGIAHVGLDGGWLRVNERLCEMVGYTREEMLHLTFQNITHAEDLEPDLANVRRLLAGELPRYSMEKRYWRKDRSLLWVNLTVALVRKPAGEPDYFISVIEDISGQKQAEDALRQATENLQRRAAELEAFNRTMVGREQRIIEMKERVNALCQELGRAPEFPPVWRKGVEP